MKWIKTTEKHFIDIKQNDDNSYNWTENNNCPNEPFLVALFTGKDTTRKFNYWLVILTEKGLEEWTEDKTYPLIGYEITEFEYWCPIYLNKF